MACPKKEATAAPICGAQSTGDTIRTRDFLSSAQHRVNKKESHGGILTKPKVPACGQWQVNNKPFAYVGLEPLEQRAL